MAMFHNTAIDTSGTSQHRAAADCTSLLTILYDASPITANASGVAARALCAAISRG
jgi:hypothetical protein